MLVVGGLLLAAACVFGRTVHHQFINFDDNEYVYENSHVTGGLTRSGIAWAFTHTAAINWHPLTWISHMADCQMFHLWAGGHHLTNVLLHAAVAALLFLVLRQLTADFWPSALAAALFAVHPLRVESVAWVAERKDLLSGLFFLLTLAAYAGYARRPFSALRYLLVLLLFALGLMAKAMLVTLPFVLLLLDYWPLGRLAVVQQLLPSPLAGDGAGARGSRPGASARSGATGSASAGSGATGSASASGCQCLGHRFTRLLLEKLPLFALSAASCAVTLLAQQIAIAPSTRFSLATRIGNALVSYVTYLGQSLYPVGLALYYPHPQDNGNLPLWQVVAAAVLLAAISAAVFVVRRNYPYLLVGWLWYLGMLVPVIGLVQVGDQAHADRYTYLPHVGLAIMLAWSAQAACHWLGKHGVIGDWSIFRPNDVLAADRPQAENMDLSPFSRPLCATASALVLALLMGLAWRQAGFWRDSETLWNHTLACTTRNATAHNNLGTVLRQSGRIAEALQQFHRALRIRPESAEIYSNLGSAFAISGHTAEALVYCQRAIQIKPDYAEGHYNLGNALFAAGRAPEAIDHFRQAIRLKAEYGAAYNNLAAVLCTSGRTAEAIPEYQHALAIQPDCAEAHYNFGKALLELGRTAEALGHFQNALPLAETAGNGPLAAACRRELER